MRILENITGQTNDKNTKHLYPVMVNGIRTGDPPWVQ